MVVIGPGVPVDVDDPDAAYRSPARWTFLTFAFAFSTLGPALVATSLWHPDGPASGSRGAGVALGTLFTVCTLGIATIIVRPRTRQTVTLVMSGDGVAIPPRPYVAARRLLPWAALAAAFVLIVAGGDTDRETVLATVGAVVLLAIATVLIVSTEDSLRMDPEGVTLPGLSFHPPTRIAWDDLRTLQARRGVRPTLQVQVDGPEPIPVARRRVPLLQIRWPASTIVDLLTFYSKNPHHRGELADLAAAETRLRILRGEA